METSKSKGKIHKVLGFQRERGEQRRIGGYCNWCWRIDHKEAQCWLKQEYKNKTRYKETFVNGRTQWRKGKVTASPKVKVKGKAKARENVQEKGTTSRTRLDLRMKKLDSAGWMIWENNVREFNLLVMSTSTMMILKCPDWIEQLTFFVFTSAKAS